MITIQELQALREELIAKQGQKQDLEKELLDLEKELARLQGLEPDGELPGEIPKPLYKRWGFWIPVGVLTAIGGIAVWKKRKK